MFDVVLYQPEIPPNTGNVLRLTANSGTRLHLIEPLGFSLEDRQLARAGLDYRDIAHATVHSSWEACQARLAGRRVFAMSTRATTHYCAVAFAPDDVFVFGPETRGLPQDVLDAFAPSQRLRLPMMPASRSLNLSNAVAIVVYEAWRQQGFASSAVPLRA